MVTSSQNSQIKANEKEEKVEIEYHPHGIYYVMPAQIMDSKLLNNTEKLCYILLSGLANENGECFPSDAYIGERINLSECRVNRVIAHLEEFGLLTKKTKRIYGERPKRTITINFNFKKINIPPPNDKNVIVENDKNVTVENDKTIYKGLESEDILESEGVKKLSLPKSFKKNTLYQNARKLADTLLFFIKKTYPQIKEPNLKKWALTIDEILRIDKRDPIQVEKIMEALPFMTFWKKQIRSAQNFRKHYDALWGEIEIPNNDKEMNKRIAFKVKEALPYSLSNDMVITNEYVKSISKDIIINFSDDKYVEKIKKIFHAEIEPEDYSG